MEAIPDSVPIYMMKNQSVAICQTAGEIDRAVAEGGTFLSTYQTYKQLEDEVELLKMVIGGYLIFIVARQFKRDIVVAMDTVQARREAREREALRGNDATEGDAVEGGRAKHRKKKGVGKQTGLEGQQPEIVIA